MQSPGPRTSLHLSQSTALLLRSPRCRPTRTILSFHLPVSVSCTVRQGTCTIQDHTVLRSSAVLVVVCTSRYHPHAIISRSTPAQPGSAMIGPTQPWFLVLRWFPCLIQNRYRRALAPCSLAPFQDTLKGTNHGALFAHVELEANCIFIIFSSDKKKDEEGEEEEEKRESPKASANRNRLLRPAVAALAASEMHGMISYHISMQALDSTSMASVSPSPYNPFHGPHSPLPNARHFFSFFTFIS